MTGRGLKNFCLRPSPLLLKRSSCGSCVEDGDVVFSLVAVEGGEVIGQALFSKLLAPSGALALGPVAVTESRRRRGIAATLIEDGLNGQG